MLTPQYQHRLGSDFPNSNRAKPTDPTETQFSFNNMPQTQIQSQQDSIVNIQPNQAAAFVRGPEEKDSLGTLPQNDQSMQNLPDAALDLKGSTNADQASVAMRNPAGKESASLQNLVSAQHNKTINVSSKELGLSEVH